MAVLTCPRPTKGYLFTMIYGARIAFSRNITHIRYAAQIVPSARQMAWQELEFYSFIHFGINTFTDKEWGLGDEDPALFNPTAFNGKQWAEVCKSAGMKGLILTCKHHDGFCLWPSAYTEHSVKNSPWRGGNGDIVKEVSDACREAGIRFGVYLSPWDRRDHRYGSSLYNEYFKDQLRELLTRYGNIFCVWFDGACGEGPNGLKQVYDWDGYYEVIRELQPGAVISVCGPDVRWCGNEAGHTRESEWSVVPATRQDIFALPFWNRDGVPPFLLSRFTLARGSSHNRKREVLNLAEGIERFRELGQGEQALPQFAYRLSL